MKRAGTILKAIFDSTNDVWFFVSPDYSILYYNKKAYENGKLFHQRDLQAGDNILDYARDTKNNIDSKFVHCFEKAKKGEIVKTEEKIEYGAHCIWVSSKYIPVYEQDALIGLSITVEDVSAQKLMEEERSTQQNEILALSNKREEFVNIASHELKTPLTSLKSSIQILSRKIEHLPDHGDLKLFIRRSEESVNKLNALIKSLLDSSKIANGEFSLEKDWFDLYTMISSCCDHFRMAGLDNIRLEGEQEQWVFADAQKLEQVLVNFLNNAVKYAPESEEILIRVERLADEVKVSVKDDGPGISEDKIHEVFKRYYKVHSSAQHNQGMGLGLYIAEGIIKQHEGRIGVESEPFKGSTFWFCIPLSKNNKV